MKLPFWPSPTGYRDIDLGLKRVFDLLARLDNPHLKIPPTIHVAGTNGKGSTIAFLRAICDELDLKTHIYTSPHLVNFNERIVLAGREIQDELLNEILTECKKAAEIEPKIPVTFFEGITVAAFLAFSKVPADVLLLEVGMGGRLDATNVLPKVLCSIITPIAFDHMDFLGETIEKIAFEKAGIIKRNCPVIVGRQQPEALAVIERVAREMESEIKVLGRDFIPVDFEVGLVGLHQRDNAAVALEAMSKVIESTSCRVANIASSSSCLTESIYSALKKATWPGRLQKITSGKFREILPKNIELYLDGSHNPQGAVTVREFIKKEKRGLTPFKVFVIFSMLKDKDCDSFLKIIADEIDELIVIEIPDEPKSRDVLELSEIAKKNKIKTITAKNLEDAFIKVKCDGEARLLVCGSLYLAGKFLELN